MLNNELLSTRIFIILLTVTLFILILYTSLRRVTRSVAIQSPTLLHFNELSAKYSDTLSCPCSIISINYQYFIIIISHYHEICSSIFISDLWVNFLKDAQRSITNTIDFRYTSGYFFQTLETFCLLCNETVADALNVFYSTQYISNTVQPATIFQSQLQEFIDRFKSTTRNTFLTSLKLIDGITECNGIISGLNTNYAMTVNNDQSSFVVRPSVYSNCSCLYSSTCTTQSAIYINSSISFIVKGIYTGCFIIQPLLESNLQCAYEQECLIQLSSYLNFDQNITALNSSSQYKPDTTLREIIIIPSEMIGSIPRPDDLIQGQLAHENGLISDEKLVHLRTKAIQNTIRELEATESPIVSDGEQTKPSFLTYPIFDLIDECYAFDDKCFAITFSDGHKRTLPRLVKAPFRYATYAYTYLDFAKQYSALPIKQAVISPSALSLVYTTSLPPIKNYTRDQFLADLINESEKDIRLCLEHGAASVQLDFTEARLSLKIDPTGKLLKEFIQINNRVLDRFNDVERLKLGVHICPGGDKDCYHSFEVDYTLILKDIFQLHLTNFFMQLSSEKDHHKVLSAIRPLIQPNHRIYVGVVDPVNPEIETAEQVYERVLEAAKYIPIEQLGTTDDCGYSPFADDRSTSREICYDKIRARIVGTKMAEETFNKNES